MQTTPPLRSPRIIALAVLLAVPVLLAAWLAARVCDLANGGIFVLGYVVCGLVGLFATVAFLGWLAKRGASMKMRRCVAGSGLAYIALLAGAWHLGGTGARTSAVHVENFSQHDLMLAMDGKPWLEAAKGSSQQVRLQHRKFEVTVKDAKSGAVLDVQQVTVDARGPFILNCLGAATYVRGTVVYSQLGIDSPFPTETSERWIRANVDHLFTKPPQRVAAKPGEKAAAKSYIVRK